MTNANNASVQPQTPKELGPVGSAFMGAAATGIGLIVVPLTLGAAFLGAPAIGGGAGFIAHTAGASGMTDAVVGAGAFATTAIGICYGGCRVARAGIRMLFNNTQVSKPWAIGGGVALVTALAIASPDDSANTVRSFIQPATPGINNRLGPLDEPLDKGLRGNIDFRLPPGAKITFAP